MRSGGLCSEFEVSLISNSISTTNSFLFAVIRLLRHSIASNPGASECWIIPKYCQTPDVATYHSLLRPRSRLAYRSTEEHRCRVSSDFCVHRFYRKDLAFLQLLQRAPMGCSVEMYIVIRKMGSDGEHHKRHAVVDRLTQCDMVIGIF